ncbi:MAG: hypothetical protein MZW92_39160 [Comamonadaceae bacterium]|nr:hypothetical protein [Comamonadaceae bacterium]
MFSPGFGWDMVSGAMDHDHIVLYVDHLDHTDHGPLHPGEVPDSHHDEHDRAGHVLGHMPGTTSVLDLVVACTDRRVLVPRRPADRPS